MVEEQEDKYLSYMYHQNFTHEFVLAGSVSVYILKCKLTLWELAWEDYKELEEEMQPELSWKATWYAIC